jgi:hypothetical protein
MISEKTTGLEKWVNTKGVTIEFREDFGKQLLVAPGGGRPEYRLMPKYLQNGYGEDTVVQFNLTFAEGRMLPNWEELLFTPLGSEPPPCLSQKLPAWKPGEEGVYSKVLNETITRLYAAETKIERLEANLPLYLDHSPESRRRLTIDRVRMVYLENVVEGPNPNFVLVVFSYLDGYKVAQNGAGGGPPAN